MLYLVYFLLKLQKIHHLLLSVLKRQQFMYHQMHQMQLRKVSNYYLINMPNRSSQCILIKKIHIF